MPGGLAMYFTDPQEYERSVRAADVRLVVSAPGMFAAKLTKVDLGRVWAQRAQVSLPTITYSTLMKDRIVMFLQFDPDQPPIRNSGLEVRSSEIVFFGAASEHHYRTEAAYHCGGISLTPQDWAAFTKIL